MNQETAKAELAQLVEDHLSRGKQDDIALGAIAGGLAQIGNALGDVQARVGNWGAILARLQNGAEQLRGGVSLLGGGGATEARSLLAFAERQLAFAAFLKDEIIRLQAGESTLV